MLNIYTVFRLNGVYRVELLSKYEIEQLKDVPNHNKEISLKIIGTLKAKDHDHAEAILEKLVNKTVIQVKDEFVFHVYPRQPKKQTVYYKFVEMLKELTKEFYEYHLEEHSGNVTEVAKQFGISRRVVYRYMDQLNIYHDRFKRNGQNENLQGQGSD